MSRTTTSETTVEISLDHPTGNFWVDMGLVVLSNHFGEGNIDLCEALEHLIGRLKTERGGWIYPANQFINTQARPETLPNKLRSRQEVCDICGMETRCIDAKMWMYPFVVDPQKFGTFYPSAKRGLKLCARCALAGLAGYLGWLYKAQGRDAIHLFVFYSPDLRQLLELYRNVILPFQLNQEGGTAPVAFFGPYLHEATLGLLLELFSHVEKSELLSEEGQALLARILGEDPSTPPAPLFLYVITGKPGQAFNMQQFQEFTRLHALYQLYKRWKGILTHRVEIQDPHPALVQVFRQFQVRRERQYETFWRDRIAWAILEFRDPFPFVEAFLFEGRAREKGAQPLAFGTLEIFELYAKEVLTMDEKLLKTLAGFGHNLGQKVQESGEIGILYDLRNTKKLDEFLKVLEKIPFRLGLTIPEDLTAIESGEKIMGSSWQRVKTLLSIYAMNAYLWANRGRSE
ncbi:MAG: hypothetical protein DRG33_07610 [Deltaproteobacteria bacterium]|nr:MAG: hypothetical protein DRG33_07610 [Deltaproteobacteria bacterium]